MASFSKYLSDISSVSDYSGSSYTSYKNSHSGDDNSGNNVVKPSYTSMGAAFVLLRLTLMEQLLGPNRVRRFLV